MTELSALLAQHHLMELGRCAVTKVDDGFDGTLVLIGPDEPDFWSLFSASEEHNDGAANPLDRWSKRTITDIADKIGGAPVFPFGGPPYQPFFTWALRTGRFHVSPIQFLVHDQRGLFASFRGGIVLKEEHVAAVTGPSPCETCLDKPCATACPAGAFRDGYDVSACKTFLASPDGVDCMTLGCGARRACPVGQGRRLPEQAALHMKAFL